MEEYLQIMKTLRSQVNGVEDQVAKFSAEEQTHSTTIHTLETDLASARSEKMQLQEDIERMMKEKSQLCYQILEKQGRIASLESDSSNLTQTMELIQQELICLSAKLTEKSINYLEVTVDINARLQQQQDLLSGKAIDSAKECEGSYYFEESNVEDENDDQTGETEGKCSFDNDPILENMGDHTRKNLISQLDSAKVKREEISEMKSKLVMENRKMKQTVDETKSRVNDHVPKLKVVDKETMEKEYNTLLSEKVGETEYLKSLQEQVERLKGFSHLVNCACGEEYSVGIDICACQKDALG